MNRAEAKCWRRVLVINSFGSAARPSTTHSLAFESELTERLGAKVEVDEVSLNYERYTDSDMDEALVEYLQKREANRRWNLVEANGYPAAAFVEKYRHQLFPKTPVLYSGMDLRRLGPDALRDNAAFVGESFHIASFVEDILRLAPDTTNIVCVIGASPVERYWTEAFQKEFARFTNRVSFTWLNDVPFHQILKRVKRLPPQSFIFFIPLIRDAAGVTQNADEALKRISEVANAPVNSIYEEQLGLGIVGGRLYRAAFEGQESARAAIRILSGEPASNLSPEIVEPARSEYDWRELRRWKISEERLPPGSIVRYRVPTVWERHESMIVSSVSVVLLQSALIAVLVVNQRRRRKAEHSLRESEERMKLAASAALLGMWEWDLASNQVWVDDAARERRKIEAGNKSESDYDRFIRTVYLEDRDGVVRALAKAIQGDGNFEHIHRQMYADGQLHWIASRGKVEFDAVHKPVKMRGVAMDITDRKLAEDRARESERQFLLVANSAPVLIWTSATDKLRTFVNQPWLDFRGRTMEQEVGNGWMEGVHPEDLENFVKTYNESFDARRPFTIEYRLRRHDGVYRWLSARGVPRYDVQKQFLGYIACCVDVTERREAEAEAQRSQQELAHVSRVSTVGALAGSLAHELNQPLTAIVTNAEAGQRMVGAGHMEDEELRDTLKDIAEQGKRAGEIIAEMRAMLKRDTGQTAPQDMNQVVKAVLEMVHADLVRKKIIPVLRLDQQLPPVEGHGVQLRQVVLNLVMNACDAMSGEPEGQRKLTVQSRRMTAEEVEISVADTGSGFAKEMLRHGFEPFRTTKAKGLGLGLAICRSIITAHGGQLVAVNNADKGATVRMMLPAQNHNGVT